VQLKTHYELTELEYTKLLSETEPAESLAHWFSLINTICIELGMEQDEEATRLFQILRFIRKLSTSNAKELAATTANTARDAICPHWEIYNRGGSGEFGACNCGGKISSGQTAPVA
jgi:hypothetical protein